MSQHDDLRVIEALRAFTGGLAVTDQDITTAQDRLREGLEPPSPRRRLVILAAAVAAVLVIGFFVAQAIDRHEDSMGPLDKPSSPADTLKSALQSDAYSLSATDFSAGPQPSAQDLAGFWLMREPYGATMFVAGNGDWGLGSVTDPFWYGTSRLAGDTWTQRFDDSIDCARKNGGPNFSHAWRAALAEDGSLHLRLTSGPNVCTPAEDREVWDRVTTGSPVADYLLAMTRRAHWQPAPKAFRWLGVYVAPANGHVLQIDSDDRYRYYDTLTEASLTPADEGDSGSIGSCSGEPSSANVEVAVLPGVADYVGSYDAVRITPTSSGCTSGVGAGEVWVKISG